MAKVTIGGREYDVEVRGESVVVDGHELPVKVREETGFLLVNAGGVQYRVELPGAADRASGMAVQVDSRPFTLEWEGRLGGGPAPRPSARPAAQAPAAAGAPRAGVKGGVAAQISGRVLSVRVQAGQPVKQGDVLLILEAMKMENEIKAPVDGTVKEVLVTEGTRVTEGEIMVVIE